MATSKTTASGKGGGTVDKKKPAAKPASSSKTTSNTKPVTSTAKPVTKAMSGTKAEITKKVDSVAAPKLNAERMSYQSKKVVREARGNEGKTGKSGIFLYHDQQGKDKTFVSSENETMAKNSPQYKAFAARKNKKA